MSTYPASLDTRVTAGSSALWPPAHGPELVDIGSLNEALTRVGYDGSFSDCSHPFFFFFLARTEVIVCITRE
jgi:hypothetical protein